MNGAHIVAIAAAAPFVAFARPAVAVAGARQEKSMKTTRKRKRGSLGAALAVVLTVGAIGAANAEQSSAVSPGNSTLTFDIEGEMKVGPTTYWRIRDVSDPDGYTPYDPSTDPQSFPGYDPTLQWRWPNHDDRDWRDWDKWNYIYQFEPQDVGRNYTVQVRFRDDARNWEVHETTTGVIAGMRPNQPSAAALSWSGDAVAGETITATVVAISDPNGYSQSANPPEWRWPDSPQSGKRAWGTNNASHELDDEVVGQTLTVEMRFRDDEGYVETHRLTSATIGARPQEPEEQTQNQPSQVSMEILGEAKVGAELTLRVTSISDPNGYNLRTTPLYKRWENASKPARKRRWALHTNHKYTVQEADIGKRIIAGLRFFDDDGHEEIHMVQSAVIMADASTPTVSLEAVKTEVTEGEDKFVVYKLVLDKRVAQPVRVQIFQSDRGNTEFTQNPYGESDGYPCTSKCRWARARDFEVGSAVLATADYRRAAKWQTIPANSLSMTFNTRVLDNRDPNSKRESNETFFTRIDKARTASGGAVLIDRSAKKHEATIFTRSMPASGSSPGVDEPSSGTADMPFTITFDEATTEDVDIEWEVLLETNANGGTAKVCLTKDSFPGCDVKNANGSFTVERGETSHTVNVKVWADDRNEGNETVVVRFTGSDNVDFSGNGGSRHEELVTGTIRNDGPIPKEWIARVGRAIGDQVFDAVTDRIGSIDAGAAEVSVAGVTVEHREQSWKTGGWENLAGENDGMAEVTEEDWLASSFRGTAGTSAGGAATVWGQAIRTTFEAEGDGLSLDGRVTSMLLGADWRTARGLAGIALGHSRAIGGYGGRTGNGMSADLTGAYPYVGWNASQRIAFWAAGGYGAGTLEVEADDKKTDLSLLIAGAGARAKLLEAPAEGGPEFDWLAEGRWTRTRSDAVRSPQGNLGAARAHTLKLASGFEARWLGLGGDALRWTPSMRAVARHDSGDAEEGGGLEVGGALAVKAPLTGFSMRIEGATLATHDDSALRETKLSGTVGWKPGGSGPMGPRVAFTHGAVEGDRQALDLWGKRDERFAGEARSRLEMEYGLPVLARRSVLTPYTAYELGAERQALSIGTKLGNRKQTGTLDVGARRTSGAGEETRFWTTARMEF